MDPSSLPLLTPLLQLGAFGVCGLLIALLWWFLAQVLSAYRGNTRAMQGATQALTSLTSLVERVGDTCQDLRDRVLEFQCPYQRDATDKPR